MYAIRSYYGHVEVQDHATLGGLSGVHQFCRVGAHAFVGGATVATKDVLPFSLTVGNRRITSYNVCYTKLLRCLHQPDDRNQRQSQLALRFGAPFGGSLVSGSAGKNLEASAMIITNPQAVWLLLGSFFVLILLRTPIAFFV